MFQAVSSVCRRYLPLKWILSNKKVLFSSSANNDRKTNSAQQQQQKTKKETNKKTTPTTNCSKFAVPSGEKKVQHLQNQKALHIQMKCTILIRYFFN